MQLVTVDNKHLSSILLHPIMRLKMCNKECKLYAAKYGTCSVQYSLR